MTETGTYQSPDLVDRHDLDLSQLRAHCREMHREAPRRSNRDLSSWHTRMHWRYHQRHRHQGRFTLVRDSRGRRPVGVNPVPLGNYTGQDPVTLEQDRAEWLARARDPNRNKEGGETHE